MNLNRITKYLSIFLLLFSIASNLVWFKPETTIKLDPNDNIFQFALVNRTNWIWENYGCPLSLKCLPNLVDHWVPNWQEGFPLPFYYSHIPQIAIVASWHMVKIFLPVSLFDYYHFLVYLLISLIPLSVFWGIKVLGLSWITAGLGALFAMHISTDGLYGIDVVSWLWRGYGLSSQLFSVITAPLALAFTYRYLSDNKYFKPALLFTVLSVAGHLGIGFITLLSFFVFVFIDFRPSHIFQRVKRLLFLFSLTFALLSYWIIPFFLGSRYHLISFWDPPWKFNSYGYYEVVKQLQNGQIFDFGRSIPILTILVLIGFFALFKSKKYFAFSLLFPFWFLLFFGRTTWGGLIDLIPGMKDFHLHRFIVGLHLAALFLIPVGIETIVNLLNQGIGKVIFVSQIVLEALSDKSKVKGQKSKMQIKSQKLEEINLSGTILKTDLNPVGSDLLGTHHLAKDLREQSEPGVFEKFVPEGLFRYGKWASVVLATIIIVFIYNYTIRQTLNYNSYNGKLITESNKEYYANQGNLDQLLSYLKTLPTERMYVGRGGNWGHNFKVGSTYMYMMVSVNGFETMGFLPETWSPNSENEQHINEQNLRDYDLYNLKYVVAPKDAPLPLNKFSLLKTYGPYNVYEVPTSGYFDIGRSNIFVNSDKTTFLNAVKYWMAGPIPDYKSYPLLSVEGKKPPFENIKIIDMLDTVSYKFNGQVYNIFKDDPFYRPEATPAGKILSQRVDKQTYSAKVSVPPDCANCFSIFKMTYHPNWIATVDGVPVKEIYTAFPFFSAVQITPGVHEVSFTYEPNRLKVILLVLEIIAVISFLIFKIRKARNHHLKHDRV
ncbi:MAG: hypothetical protein UU37_C0007G0006 [Candidatus Gottesmanbacteria bacterium GW2011_GWA2_41_12]|uniref:Membrane protein 6-pyruvoyl-tetrahydropterin synthase-related domain-containing protein n=1 Tax=Candidatus Gottesmanbacteria bacterium GW2011_GWA2_41_12 TaxID=1618440 RepID=A0A0G0UHI1_9BACT|nr:MAG: hypothetical protein UU37_C0007G0006 [Candidatus Gottesmanbacteria bacterium GW2011_GWA2_41_12]